MPDDEHPVLALAREADEITSAIGDFFNSTERYHQPPPPGGWPRDLTSGELASLVPRLNATLENVRFAIENMIEEDSLAARPLADPGKAQLVTSGLGFISQGYDAVKAGETLFGPAEGPAAAGAQRQTAARNFPQGPGAAPQPASGTAGPAGPGEDAAARRRRGGDTGPAASRTGAHL
jgi:hypothetical protein